MRPEDNEMTANICSFEHMEEAINEFQPFKAPGSEGIYPALLQKGWNQLKGYYCIYFSSIPETQFYAIGMERRHRYISSKTRKAFLKLHPSV